MNLIRTLILFATFIFSSNADAIVKISDETSGIDVVASSEYVVIDKDYSPTLSESFTEWIEPSSSAVLFNNQKNAYLYRVVVQNLTSDSSLVFSCEQPNIDHFELFDSEFRSINVTGDIYSWATREFKEAYPVFRFKASTNKTDTVYVKMYMSENGVAPLKVFTLEKYYKNFASREFLMGVFMGLMGVIALYNFFLFLSVKDRLYLYYSLYVISIGFAQSAILGNSLGHLYHSFNILMEVDGLIFPAIMTLPGWLFVKQYFGNDNKSIISISLDCIIVCFLLISFFVLFRLVEVQQVYWIIDILFFTSYLLIISFGIMNLHVNKFPAIIFLCAWGMLLIGASFYVLIDLNIVTYSPFKLYLMPIGVALETVILSFALGYRIRILKKEKEESEYVLSLEKEKSQEQSAEHKESQLKSLRGQLNPHFVFNALNSIQNFLTKDHKEKADVFLSKFATLMRRSLDLTSQRFIPISKEISFLQDYLKIEELRFEDKFNYTFSIDKHFKKHDSKIPPLLTQPFLENAIKHAFPDDKSGTIDIKFIYDKPSHRILVVIEDNGVGLKPNSMTNSESKGIEITRKRIKIINSEDHNYQISLSIINKSDASNNTGVLVQLDIPDLN